MKLKVLLSVVILTGALGQLYNHYVSGFTYNKLVARDKLGFVIDGKMVKITASQEDLEAYKKLITGELGQDIRSQIESVENQQRKMMKQLDEVSGIDPGVVKSTPPEGQLVAESSHAEGSDGLPTLPPVPEEVGELPPLPQNPEGEEAKTADGDETSSNDSAGNDLPPPPPTDINEETAGVPESPAGPQAQSPAESAALDAGDKKEKNDGASENSVEVSQNEHPPKTKPKFDPIKELAARNLMSCTTKNSKGRIPALIWNYIVSRSSATEYVTTGEETLPQIAETMLNDESCWPKLWSQNPALENPYDIPSGLTISIVPNAPRLPANEAAEESEAEASGEAPASVNSSEE